MVYNEPSSRIVKLGLLELINPECLRHHFTFTVRKINTKDQMKQGRARGRGGGKAFKKTAFQYDDYIIGA